jgi:hypothetical protein
MNYFNKILKHKNNLIGLIVLSYFILNSCSIEKRVHQKGYYINWNKKIDKNEVIQNQHLINDSSEELETNNKKNDTIHSTNYYPNHTTNIIEEIENHQVVVSLIPQTDAESINDENKVNSKDFNNIFLDNPTQIQDDEVSNEINIFVLIGFILMSLSVLLGILWLISLFPPLAYSKSFIIVYLGQTLYFSILISKVCLWIGLLIIKKTDQSGKKLAINSLVWGNILLLLLLISFLAILVL